MSRLQLGYGSERHLLRWHGRHRQQLSWGEDDDDEDSGDMGTGQGVLRTEAVPRMMGILSVDLIDVRQNQLVWRGQATTDVVAVSQKGDEKQVLKSIDKMFKQFPPKKK